MILAPEFMPALHNPSSVSTSQGGPGSGNFMTPEIVAVYRRAGMVFEISAGDAIICDPKSPEYCGPRLFGVTVWARGGGRLDPDPSGCFHSLSEALAHARWVEMGQPTCSKCGTRYDLGLVNGQWRCAGHGKLSHS